jgi:hypothetical protein
LDVLGQASLKIAIGFADLVSPFPDSCHPSSTAFLQLEATPCLLSAIRVAFEVKLAAVTEPQFKNSNWSMCGER